MGEREATKGWKISQVERLIDLPRRDIQRACYSGQGGADIVRPSDGAWGKRFYSVDDIAQLMLVKLYKDQGYCLPEIRDMINGSNRQIDTAAELSIWQARLEEELLENEIKLSRILALLAALRNKNDDSRDASEEFLAQRLPPDVIKYLEKALTNEIIDTTIPEAFESYLDEPGMDLAIDLWAGPGTYDHIVNDLWK